MTFDSAAYWEERYAAGGNSGLGSRGDNARRKADYLNHFVKEYMIRSVLEFGCGDGYQLSLANYPDYVGLDVSETAVKRCRTLFALDAHKRFYLLPTLSLANYPDYVGLDVSETAVQRCRTLFALDSHKRFYLLPTLTAELVLSLDVTYHLTENSVYSQHLADVFGSVTRFVILYTTDSDVVDPSLVSAEHVKHRPVCRDVTAGFREWLMVDCVLTAGGSGFYTYQRR